MLTISLKTALRFYASKKRKAHRTQIVIAENLANSNTSSANEAPTTSSTSCSASAEQPVDEVVNKEPEQGHSYDIRGTCIGHPSSVGE